MTSIRDRRLPLGLAALLLASCASPGATRDGSAVTESSDPRFAASGCGSGSWGGQCLSMGDSVTGPGATRGEGGAGGC